MTGRVDILWCIFEKNAKKLNEVTGNEKNWFWSKNIQKIHFFWSCYFNFNVFAVFSKKRQSKLILLVIWSSIKVFGAQTSRTLLELVK